MTAADNAFIKEHEALVRKLVHGVRAQMDLKTDVDELMAYGYQGLLEAKSRFDPERGVKFTTFAYYRIRGAVLDGVRQMAYLPRRVHANRKAAEVLDQNAEDVATQRITAGNDAPRSKSALAAIDQVLHRTSAAYVIACLGQSEDDGPEQPDEALLGAEASKRVKAALKILPEREYKLVTGFYFGDQTLEEIGQTMGISKSWASRLHARALSRLRNALT